MSKLRDALHQVYFTTYELEALKPLLVRIGKERQSLTRSQVEDLLLLSYSLPAKYRSDPARSVAAIVIAAGLLSTVRRHEMARHLGDGAFLVAASDALDTAQDEIDRQRDMLRGGLRS